MTRGILVTGGSGQVATALQRHAWPDHWRIVATDRATLDMMDIAAIRAAIDAGIDGMPWAAVINCAAYTAADKAEDDIAAAWAINALAPAALAHACADSRVPLVHISTDYIFSGEKTGAWEVGDAAYPRNVYGASKLGGELAIRTSRARHAIVRTSWVVSAHGHNFIKTMLRLGAERGHVRVVDDQIGSPTSAADLAHVLAAIAVALADDEQAPTGTFQFSNAGAVSWAGFASEIFRQSALRSDLTATVEPIATSDYATRAQRPANSRLSHDAIQAAYGITPRPWQDALGDILDELIGAVK